MTWTFAVPVPVEDPVESTRSPPSWSVSPARGEPALRLRLPPGCAAVGFRCIDTPKSPSPENCRRSPTVGLQRIPIASDMLSSTTMP